MTRRILIADALATNRIALRALLTAAHYDVEQVASGVEAVESVHASPPDLVLADVALPNMSGPDLCAQLRTGPSSGMPPVLFLGTGHDAQLRLDVLRSGADDLMFRPIDGNALLARIRGLLRAHDAAVELRCRDATTDRMAGVAGFAEAVPGFRQPGRVAIIGAPGDERAIDLATALRRHLPHRIEVTDAATALGSDEDDGVPDVFVLAVDVPGPDDSLPLLSELRSRPATRHSAILALHSVNRRGAAGRALDLGAGDVAEATAEIGELAHRIAVQIQRKRDGDRLRADDLTLRTLATIDPLTGLFNRRYALEHLAALALAPGAGLAVLMIDIDHFKAVNDAHGHGAGDAVLVQIAARLRNDLRGVDMMARMGGEEFLVALPDMTLARAVATAERLRALVAGRPAEVPGVGPLAITVSLGLALHAVPAAADASADAASRAASTAAGKTGAGPRRAGGPAPRQEPRFGERGALGRAQAVSATIDRADQALYAAKRAGRNRVCRAPAVQSAPPDTAPPEDARRAPDPDRLFRAVPALPGARRAAHRTDLARG